MGTLHYLSLQLMKKSVALHTLGCKLNYAETSALSRVLEDNGYEKKDFTQIADVYVINTCSVTDNADKECRQLVRRIQRLAPGSMVVITGCYAQLKPQEIASIEGVDLVLGAAEKFNIVQHLDQLTKGDPAKICSCDITEVVDFHTAHSINDRTRTFLKVQDGCNYNCSFCTIPMARGKSRSDSIFNIVTKAEQLARDGVKEIVLTGINLGDFGALVSPTQKIAFPSKQEDLIELITALDNVEGIQRFRISSIEPNLLTFEMIDFIAGSKKFMPHFHMPLQSGSNKILGLMKRRYKKELYMDKVKYIKEVMPHASVGADVIVGFPAESEDDFKATADLITAHDVSYLHVFTYSERMNTAALDIKPIVPINIRNERNKFLRNLSYEKAQLFSSLHSGQTRPVLFERNNKNNMMEGYTDNYIKVTASFNKEWENQVVQWQL